MQFKKVSNPLTIVAIFSGLAEVCGTVVTPLLDKDIVKIYIWFLIGFPTLLLILFFVTLWSAHKKLYAPSDFESDISFLKMNSGSKVEENKMAADDVKPITIGTNPNVP